MKKCTKCGAILDNSNTTCVDCGAKLGPALSAAEESEIYKNVSETIQKPIDTSEYFHVSKSDKRVALLLLIGVLGYLLVLYLFRQSIIIEFKSFIYLEMIWMAVEAFNIVNPRITWKIYRLRMSTQLSNPKDLQPTEAALHLRRGVAYFTVFVGYALLFYIILKMILW